MSRRKLAAAVAAAAAMVVLAVDLGGSAQASTTKHVTNARPATSADASGKTASTSAAAVAKVAGYKVVNSGSLAAPATHQTHGSVICPSGKTVLGGGVFVSSGSTSVNVNSSYPTNNGWAADINNGSGSATTFTVYAVCGKKPQKYAVVFSAFTTVNAGTQAVDIAATCTSGKPLSGGLFSDTTSTLANANSSLPAGSSWRIDANNASASAEHVQAFVICGKLPKYKVVTGTATVNGAGLQTGATAACKTGQQPVGGGSFSNSGSTLVSVNTSYPSGSGWTSYMNNASGSSETFTPYVVCGG